MDKGPRFRIFAGPYVCALLHVRPTRFQHSAKLHLKVKVKLLTAKPYIAPRKLTFHFWLQISLCAALYGSLFRVDQR